MGCRVMLRRMRAADEDEFLQLAEQSAELHADWVRTPTDALMFREYLGHFSDPTAHEALLIKRVDTGAIAGHATLTGIVRGPYDRAVLGFAAFAPSTGRGFMTEGIGLTVLYAFGPLGLHRVEADIQPGNEPSRRLVQRLGFRREDSPGVHQHRRRLARPRTLGDHRQMTTSLPHATPTSP